MSRSTSKPNRGQQNTALLDVHHFDLSDDNLDNLWLILEQVSKDGVFIPRVYLRFTGSVNRALLLAQLVYWTPKAHDPNGWIYKTYKELLEELGLSEYEVRNATRWLKENDLVETKLRAVNKTPTLHYRVNRRNLTMSILKFLKNASLRNLGEHPEETQGSLTETTSKTTNKEDLSAEQNAFASQDHPLIKNKREAKRNISGQTNVKREMSPHFAMLKAYEELIGERVEDGPRVGRVVKQLLQEGVTPDDLRGCYAHMKGDTYWIGIAIPLEHVRKNIFAWIQDGRPAPRQPEHTQTRAYPNDPPGLTQQPVGQNYQVATSHDSLLDLEDTEFWR